MDRNREARRVTAAEATAANGLSRRRHRTTSLRDSPDGDGGTMELQETTRLRDRGVHLKKDRERDRERERDRDRLSSRSKRRRGDRLLLHGADDSSEGSVNDEDDEDDYDGGGGPSSSMRMHPPASTSSFSSSSFSNHHHNSNGIQSHRKNLPPPVRVPKTPAMSGLAFGTSTWKVADEMIGVPVPRKARSASTKRVHECWTSSATGVATSGEHIYRQASTSPARASPAHMLTSPSRATSPSSSSASARKKMPNGQKQRPPKSSSKASSSAQDEIEIEIAEVLFGLAGNDSTRFESTKSTNNSNKNQSTNDTVKSPIPSPICLPNPSSVAVANSTSFNTSMSAIFPKRKKPRSVKIEEDNTSSTSKTETDLPTKLEASSPNRPKNSGYRDERGLLSLNSMNSEAIEPIRPERNPAPSSNALSIDAKGRDVEIQSKSGVRLGDNDDHHNDSTSAKSNSTAKDGEEKFQIDLMAPPLRSSPVRESDVKFVAVDPKAMATDKEMEDEAQLRKVVSNTEEEQVKSTKTSARKSESDKPVAKIDLLIDLEKSGGDDGGIKPHHVQQQQLPNNEKTARSGSLPIPISMASWPGGTLPPVGYMSPLQGVVSMDGSALSAASIQPPHVLFNQPRPKRCATHSYIARNISYHQQFMKMNPFWPAAPGSAPVYGGAKPNIMPSSDFQGGLTARMSNSVQDLTQGQNVKEKSSQSNTHIDRKQIFQQQTLPPVGANNILHGPTFIFPITQQHAAAVVPGSVKTIMATGNAAASGASNPVSLSNVTLTPGGTAPAMSYNYPNMPETQYLAILQNNGYTIPVQANVGAQPAYRANQLPFFNGPFYSSPVLHPPHLQQQMLTQAQLNQQGHQNPSASNTSAVPQKHLQSQQLRPGINNVTMQRFPAQKNQSSQPLQGEDNPSTADSRVNTNVNLHNQNFSVQMQPSNTSGGSHGKKPQLPGSRSNAEPQAFAMSFTSVNAANSTPAIDMSSIAQNHSVLQSIPEGTRQGYQMMAAAVAAQAAQQKKYYRASEEAKPDANNGEEERKAAMAAKQLPSNIGQSIAFSRPDLTDAAPISNVVDSSAQASRNHSSAISAHQRSQQQQMMQSLQKQHQAAATNRNKTPSTGNGNVYSSDHLPPSTIAAKFPNALSGYPQNLVQTSNSPAQSPQWKNSARPASTTQVPTSHKNLAQQQQGRQQQNHLQTQISFSANPKLTSTPQAQQSPSTTNQSPSPSTSSISKNTGGSPRMAAVNKGGQASSSPLSAVSNRKSSPVQSILGNPHFVPSPNMVTKSQLPKQPQQLQQLPKHALQAQLYFSSAYMQAPSGSPQQSTGTNPSANGYYLQRHRTEQAQMGSSPTITKNTATSDPAKAMAAATAKTTRAESEFCDS